MYIYIPQAIRIARNFIFLQRLLLLYITPSSDHHDFFQFFVFFPVQENRRRRLRENRKRKRRREKEEVVEGRREKRVYREPLPRSYNTTAAGIGARVTRAVSHSAHLLVHLDAEEALPISINIHTRTRPLTHTHTHTRTHTHTHTPLASILYPDGIILNDEDTRTREAPIV